MLSFAISTCPLLIWSVEVAGLADEVEIEAAPSMLTIIPSTHPRAGWAEAAAVFDLDGLLDEMTRIRFAYEELPW